MMAAIPTNPMIEYMIKLSLSDSHSFCRTEKPPLVTYPLRIGEIALPSGSVCSLQWTGCIPGEAKGGPVDDLPVNVHGVEVDVDDGLGARGLAVVEHALAIAAAHNVNGEHRHGRHAGEPTEKGKEKGVPFHLVAVAIPQQESYRDGSRSDKLQNHKPNHGARGAEVTTAETRSASWDRTAHLLC